MPRFIDLSAPIVQSPEGLPEPLRTDIELAGHAAGAQAIETLFGVGPELLRDGEGWAVETFTRFGTHNSTHVDAPWHYNSTIGGERAATIDELPLEWFHAPGVCLDFTAKADGEAVTADDVETALFQPRARAGPARHRPDPHRARRLSRGPRLHGPRPGRDRRGHPLALRPRRPGHGHRRVGLGPAAAPAGARRRRRRGAPGIFWAAHQADLAYSQIERLCNLGSLPPVGFTVSCFPLRIVGASAGPARVVAMLDA